jgi:hypothetical protein
LSGGHIGLPGEGGGRASRRTNSPGPNTSPALRKRLTRNQGQVQHNQNDENVPQEALKLQLGWNEQSVLWPGVSTVHQTFPHFASEVALHPPCEDRAGGSDRLIVVSEDRHYGSVASMDL